MDIAIRLIKKLNSPIVVSIVLVIALAANGFLFYRSQQYLPPVAEDTSTRPTTERLPLVATEPTVSLAEATEIQGNTVLPEEATSFSEADEDVVGVRVVVRIVDAPTWLRLGVDGQPVAEGNLEPGFATELEGEQEVNIQTGNAGAIQVEVNGQDLGRLGTSGEVGSYTLGRSEAL